MIRPTLLTPTGQLIAIGGAEDKTRDLEVLGKVIARAREDAPGTPVAVAVLATASRIPEEVLPEYVTAFRALGACDVHPLAMGDRRGAHDPDAIARIQASSVIYFTGGDQTRLTSILGGSPALDAILKRYADGAVIAGTSAGAAAMSAAMITGGPSSDGLYRDAIRMASGLGLVEGLVFDTHFLERGRFTRLMALTAANPGTLGVGIGENCAVQVHRGQILEVAGPGHVAIVDGRGIGRTNAAEAEAGAPIAVEGLTMHALIDGYGYDARKRRVLAPAELDAVLSGWPAGGQRASAA